MSILSFLRAFRDRIIPSETDRARETLMRLGISWQPGELSRCCRGLVVGHDGRQTSRYCAACGGPIAPNFSGDDFWIGFEDFVMECGGSRPPHEVSSEAREAIRVVRDYVVAERIRDDARVFVRD